MAIIYRKTAKGMAEIETRAHRLVPRMRSALILVDGKRSDAEIGGMILQQVTETLHALAGQGFIEVLAVNGSGSGDAGGGGGGGGAVASAPLPPSATATSWAASVPRPAAAAVATPFTPLPSPSPSPSPAPTPMPAPAPAGPDFQSSRRAAARAVTDLLGPAAESVAMRIERARNPDELRAALTAAVQTVGNIRGRQAAEAFAARFADL